MMSRFLKLFGLFVFTTTSFLTASPPLVKDLQDIAEQCTFRVRYEEDFCVDPFQAQPRGSLLTLDAREFFNDPDGTIFVEWNARGLDKEGSFPKINATSEDTIESVFLAMRALADTKYGSDPTLKVSYSLYMKASSLPFESAAHRRSLCEAWSHMGMIHLPHSDQTRLHRDQSIFQNYASSIPVTLELENFGVIPHPTPFGEVLSNPLIEKIMLKKTRIPFFALGS